MGDQGPIFHLPVSLFILTRASVGHYQGGILTVILASGMTGNPQISGEISGQNHALFMSQMGSVQNHA